MYKQFIRLTASLLALMVYSPDLLASSSDFQKPITVDARTQSMDGKNKITRFKDNVKITQGSLVIEADEVEVSAKGGEGREIMIARGNPARYSQTMDDGSKVEAKARELRYELAKRTISMTGDAQIKQNTSLVQGDSITYDMMKEQLLATSSDENENSRVKTVFSPEAIKAVDGQESAGKKEKNDASSRGDQ